MDRSKKIKEHKNEVLKSKEFEEYKTNISGSKLEEMVQNLKTRQILNKSDEKKPSEDKKTNLNISLWKQMEESLVYAEVLSNFLVLVHDWPEHSTLNSKIVDEIKIIDENLKLMKHKVELVSALIIVLVDNSSQG